jgi:hypothetical protein
LNRDGHADPECQDPDVLEVKYSNEYQRVRYLQSLLAERPYNQAEIEELLQLARFEVFWVIQLRALTALWFVKEDQWRPQIIDSMLLGLKSPMSSVRAYAATGLSKHRATESIPLLLDCLQFVTSDEEELAVRRALEKLGHQQR